VLFGIISLLKKHVAVELRMPTSSVSHPELGFVELGFSPMDGITRARGPRLPLTNAGLNQVLAASYGRFTKPIFRDRAAYLTIFAC